MRLGQKARAGMVWQSSAGGFCTEAAHPPRSLACSALPNTSGALQSKEINAKLRVAPSDAQGEPRKSNQPQNSFMRIFFSWLGVEFGRSFVGWGCQSRLHPSPAPFSLAEGAHVNLFICLCSTNRIRGKKSLETVGQSAPAHGDEHRDGDLCSKQWKNSKHVFIFCILPFMPPAGGKKCCLYTSAWKNN